MAVSFHHVAVLFALIFTWFWATKARLISENQGNFLEERPAREKLRSGKDKFFLTDEYVPDGGINVERSYRAPRKVLQQNFELFTARGYGKRSAAACMEGSLCKKQLPFFGARRYGKRDLKDGSVESKRMRKIICLFTDCNKQRTFDSPFNLDNPANYMKNKEEKLPEDDSRLMFD